MVCTCLTFLLDKPTHNIISSEEDKMDAKSKIYRNIISRIYCSQYGSLLYLFFLLPYHGQRTQMILFLNQINKQMI